VCTLVPYVLFVLYGVLYMYIRIAERYAVNNVVDTDPPRHIAGCVISSVPLDPSNVLAFR
jgi:hypothetical protein